MSGTARFTLWLRALFTRRRVEQKMAREMQSHIEMATEHYVSLGVPRDEARRRAMAEFGGVERYKEDVRAERGTGALDALLTDLRMTIRSLAKHRAFTSVVVLTLAIGIGATTAVYSWANWALYRPVPGVRDPGRAVTVDFEQITKNGIMPTGMSYPNFADLAATVKSFSGLAGYTEAEAQLSAPGIEPTQLDADVVLGDYFGVLGTTPRLGRAFSAAELEPRSEERVVVISDSLWRAAFDGAREVLGRPVTVNGIVFTVIGVAPPGFRGTDRTGAVDLWFPTAAYGVLTHRPLDLGDRRVNAFQHLLGRMRRGVTPESAQNDVNRRLNMLVAAYPGINGVYTQCHAVVNPDLGQRTFGRQRVVDLVQTLLGIVALLLLIACANVANLLLLRGTRRREELAVRRALGASATRLVAQHLVEGTVLAFAGGALGLVIAWLLARIFASVKPEGLPQYRHLMLDGRVLVLATVLCVTTGLLCGLAPAVAALRHDPMRDLKTASRNQARGRTAGRSSLTVIQIGGALALVVGALLLGRTLYNAAQVHLGFDAEQVSVFWIDARPQGYAPDRLLALRRGVLDRTAALPGVQGVAIASWLPGMGQFINGGSLHAAGDTSRRGGVPATTVTVSSDFFRVLRIPLRSGRAFTAAEFDDPAAHVAILSAGAARELFGSAQAVGRQIQLPSFGPPQLATVVGVTEGVRVAGPEDPNELAVYMPAAAATGFMASMMNAGFALVVRSPRRGEDLRRDLRDILAREAPGLPVPTAEDYAAIARRSVAAQQLFARLVGVLAALAAVLATIGLYSVVAFAVAERTREIGIRMALGARRTAVVRLVARQSALLTLAGLVLGTAGAVALARVLASRLFGVTAYDSLTYGAAIGVWAVLAVAASVVPARAATRVDPTIAMRAE